jgi:hypothetical protein
MIREAWLIIFIIRSNMSITYTLSNPRRWTKEEDALLINAVDASGAKHWKGIATHIPGRDHSQCLQRWSKTLKPGIVKGRWTPDEDKTLSQLYRDFGADWRGIAQQITGRTSKQCRQRWCFQLDPILIKTAFTAEEDVLLLNAYERLGSCWAKIATALPGRTADAVKVRHKSLQRKEKRSQGRMAAAAKPVVKQEQRDAVSPANVPQESSTTKKRKFALVLEKELGFGQASLRKINLEDMRNQKRIKTMHISEFLKDFDLEDEAFLNDVNALLDAVPEF